MHIGLLLVLDWNSPLKKLVLFELYTDLKTPIVTEK